MNRHPLSRTRSALATGVVGLLSFALLVPPGAQAAPVVDAAPATVAPTAETAGVAADVTADDAADVTAPDPAAAEPVAPESEEAEFVPAEEAGEADPDDVVPLLAPEAEPQVATADATGFAVVGVTWSGHVTEDALAVEVRTSTDPEAPADGDAGWDAWEEVSAEPSPDGTLDGTEPVVVGDVARVQARVSSTEPVHDLKLTVVDPGTSPADDDVPTPPEGVSPGGASVAAASAVTPRPSIKSRKAWGANEKMMTWKPKQGSIRAATIHHTAGTNNYSKSNVAPIIRGIYAYHAKTRGWGDIGYNFLVDKYGRVWEGRSGGVTKQTVGGHAVKYNTNSTGISVLGNYETATVSNAAVSAVVGLAAWKLSLHGVPAKGKVTINGGKVSRIHGHRNVAQTACPGRTLYAKMGEIRNRAAAAQKKVAVKEGKKAQGKLRDGSFVKNPKNGKVAMVEKGRKHLATCAMVKHYGGRCGNATNVTTAQWRAFVADGRLQRTVRTPKDRVYRIVNGKKREAFDMASLKRAGKQTKVVTLRLAAIKKLPHGKPIVRPGVVVINRKNGNHRLVVKGRKHGYLGSALRNRTPLQDLDRGRMAGPSVSKMPKVARTTGVIKRKNGRQFLLTRQGTVRIDGTGRLRGSAKTQDWSKALMAEVPRRKGRPDVVAVRQNGKSQIYILRNGVLRPVSKARARQVNGGSMPKVHVILKVTKKQFSVGSRL